MTVLAEGQVWHPVAGEFRSIGSVTVYSPSAKWTAPDFRAARLIRWAFKFLRAGQYARIDDHPDNPYFGGRWLLSRKGEGYSMSDDLEAAEGVIVSAVASMTAHGEQGGASEAAILNAKIQDAMVAAIVDAQARGVTDTEELRAVQLAARDKALATPAGE